MPKIMNWVCHRLNVLDQLGELWEGGHING